jgi:hypothetical protein
MQYVKTGTDNTFAVDFIVNDEMVVPDNGTVTLTVSEMDGSALSGYDGAALSPGSNETYISFEISAAANAKANDFELREVVVYFEYDSKPHKITFNYQIVDRTNIPVSPDQVRILLGISSDELSDEYLDLVKAYTDVEEEYDGSDLNVILEGGTSSIKFVLEAIKYKAAINVVPSIELIAVQSQQADNVSFRRFEEVDFAALKAKLNGEYNKNLKAITGDNNVDPVFTTTGVGTDAVTGE